MLGTVRWLQSVDSVVLEVEQEEDMDFYARRVEDVPCL